MDDDDHEPRLTLPEFLESVGASITGVLDHVGDLMIRAWFYPARWRRSRTYVSRHSRVA